MQKEMGGFIKEQDEWDKSLYNTVLSCLPGFDQEMNYLRLLFKMGVRVYNNWNFTLEQQSVPLGKTLTNW